MEGHSIRRPMKRALEPVDEWLHNEKYYRKHTPKDSTCLFRAFAEQIYKNQRFHIRVRQECVEFMRKNRHMFEEKIPILFDNYLEQMCCITEWGGTNEILAMSILYKRNVVMFHAQHLKRDIVADHGFADTINLCFSPPRQYDSVFTQEHTSNAAFCQSLVYRTLYKNVFKMENVDATVNKMLHDRTNNFRYDRFYSKNNAFVRDLELYNRVQDYNIEGTEMQLIAQGITPFPYRVAKALDPYIYRNIDSDIYQEIRREIRNSGKFNPSELQTGSKCLIQLDHRDIDFNFQANNNNYLSSKENIDWNSKSLVPDNKRNGPLFYTGYIQEMNKNGGPAVVFIEELGQRRTVPFHALKPFPLRKGVRQNWAMIPQKRNCLNQSFNSNVKDGKWKKPWNSSARKVKDNNSYTKTNRNQPAASKSLTKNVLSKSEWSTETTLENHSVKVQSTTYETFSTSESVRTVLENTHIAAVEKVEQIIVDKKSVDMDNTNLTEQNTGNQFEIANELDKNLETDNSAEKSGKTEKLFTSYLNTNYPHENSASETEVNLDVVKSVDLNGSDLPYSDPVTLRHFFNLGLKFFWSQNQNAWNSGTTQPNTANSSCNFYNNPIPSSVASIENGSNPEIAQTSGSLNNQNQSSTSNKEDHVNVQNEKSISNQNIKLNQKNVEPRNSNVQKGKSYSEVSKANSVNKNSSSADKNVELNINNKEVARNKSNGLAPRFKKNNEGKSRNANHSYNSHQYQHHVPHHEMEFRGNNAKRVEPLTVSNQCEASDPIQQEHYFSAHQQQAQINSLPSGSNCNSYAYPLQSYNSQIPYIPPQNIYSSEAEGFSNAYYPNPPAFVPMTYAPTSDTTGEASVASYMPAVYQGMDSYSSQYPPVYPQYIPYQQTLYTGPQSSNITENCYLPYQGPPCYVPYTSMPPNPSITTQNPTSG